VKDAKAHMIRSDRTITGKETSHIDESELGS